MTRLWQSGLLYRREALVNWSCQLRSAISDIEVERVEVSGPTALPVPGYDRPVVFGELTDFAYNVCGSGQSIRQHNNLQAKLFELRLIFKLLSI